MSNLYILFYFQIIIIMKNGSFNNDGNTKLVLLVALGHISCLLISKYILADLNFFGCGKRGDLKPSFLNYKSPFPMLLGTLPLLLIPIHRTSDDVFIIP